MAIKVSVIIPVFNAEPYMNKCIESLLNQTLSDCEYIFVNDGSKDHSQAIIEAYQKKDSRIKLINQENQGVSAARNAGLVVAKGEFVGFVDADDIVVNNMFEQLYTESKRENCDAVISNFFSESNGLKRVIEFPFDSKKVLEEFEIKHEIIPYLIKSDHFNSVWNKIFSRQLILSNNLLFPRNLSLGEDGVFNLRFFCYARRAKYIKEPLYHYKEVMGSATRNIRGKDYFLHSIESYKRSIPELENIMEVKQLNYLKSMKLIQNVMSFIHLYFNPSEEFSFNNRYKYVKNMIQHPLVKEAMMLAGTEYRETVGRYEKLMLQLIKNKFTFGLYCLTAYSRFRNQ